ncbi:MAG: DUF4157 domain-containing protein [Phycisphaerales bacterium]
MPLPPDQSRDGFEADPFAAEVLLKGLLDLNDLARRYLGDHGERVSVRVGPEPRAAGCEAFAYGGELYIDPDLFEQPMRRVLEVFGHELCHVAQQRAGRVRVRNEAAGVPCNADPELEREADEWGRCVARGEPAPNVGSALDEPPPPVLQPVVAVGGGLLQSAADLDERARAVIDLIDGGAAWLDRAMGPRADSYWFEDVESLVSGVQEGLHGSPLMLLRSLGLQVSPRRLLLLSNRMLLDMLTNEGVGGDDDGAESAGRGPRGTGGTPHAGPALDLARRLVDEGLWTQEELGKVPEFLQRLAPGATLFQAVELGDWVGLHELMVELSGTGGAEASLRKQAAGFALGRAVNPAEFVDYSRLFLSLAGSAGEESRSERRHRGGRIGEICDALLDEARGYMRCPTVHPDASASDVHAALASWLQPPNRLGFARLSSAACQFAASLAPFAPLDSGSHASVDLADGISRSMSAVEAHALSVVPRGRSVTQDGKLVIFNAENHQARTTLRVDRSGSLTLVSHSRKA